MKAPFPIVAVGASAGGLEAFTGFLKNFPCPSGMAVIFVQHLDPLHKSMMVDLLKGHTRMKVQEAVNGAPVEPDNVYIIPAGASLAVEAGLLVISEPIERHGARLPFDFLLHSLAGSIGDRAIGVVLSGNGADGVAGLRAIKRAGGLVAAQSPDETEHKGMPLSVIQAGVADIILPVGKIPGAVIGFLSAAQLPDDVDPGPQLGPIVNLLRERLAHDFTGYKPGTLTRRIKRRMAVHGISDPTAYLELLDGEGKEAEALAKDLLIHVTGFYRDPAVFDHLAAKVIPDLVRDHPPGHPLRVWVPACSTGEEAYSLAILFLEEIQASKKRIQLQVFGSDIDDQATATARTGGYPAALKGEISPERLERFFVEEESGYRIGPVLREVTLFTTQNILTDPPFARLDFVSCRNLLIYLLPDAQQRVLGLLHFALRKDGVLVLGASENVGDLRQGFEPIAPDLRIFRRVGSNRRLSLQTGAHGQPRAQRAMERRSLPHDLDLGDAARRVLADTYAPASVVVNSRNEGVFHCGATGNYLQMPRGDATSGLFAMAAPGLRNKLRTAIRHARTENRPVSASGGSLKRGDATVDVRIDVRSLYGEESDLLLVSFSDTPQKAAAGQKARKPVDASRVEELEASLDALQKEVDQATEELERSNAEQDAVNEELLSLNEEYQSTNEELETSKEELQSLNEELTALNSQLSATVNQQRGTADDLDNILRSADLAIVFLDPSLNIRFLSTAAKTLFGAIDSDLGRPISDLARKFDDAHFAADVRVVLDSHAPVDREIRAHGGEWFARRIVPYRAQSGALQGVVLTLSDISIAKAAELKLAVERSYVSSVTDTVRQSLVVLDDRLHIVSANRSFCRTFKMFPAAITGRALAAIAGGRLDCPAMNTFLDRALAEQAAIEDYEVEIEGEGGERMVLLLSARPLPEEIGAGRRVLVAIDNITERRLISDALEVAKSKAEKANLGKSRFLAAASHDLRQPLQTLSLLHGVLARKLTDPEALGLIDKLNETLGAMAGMLDTLLDINQLEAGTVQPEVDVFAVNTVFHQLKSEIGYLARSKGLTLRTVGCGLYVRSDPLLLAQMLRNLLSNALKYTKRGKVLIGCRRRGDKLRLEIRDTGIGIHASQLEAIFDEYHQLDNPARERGLGLGLGLSIVKRLAGLLGHEVGVQSTPGKGSLFFVDVPLARPPKDEKILAIANVPAPPARRGDTVLIVEDDPMVSDALEMLFRSEGYRTVIAADGAQVAMLLERGGLAPDIVVADYNLPGAANGLEVVAALRRAAGRHVPAVILTGDIAADVLRKVMAADCNFFHKPVNVDQLVRTVHDILATATAPASREPAPARGADDRPVIHVVDDDMALLELLRQMLTNRGRLVETYASAEIFLASKRSAVPGCLVVDSVMPGMSGLDLLRRLKAEHRSLPAIVITGYGDIQMAIKSMNAGATDFVEKPAREDVLLASIDRALAQAGEGGALSAPQREASATIAALTNREREVMHLVVEGQPNKEIALQLGISQRTVETHRAAVMKRTRSASLPDLIRLVMQAG